MMQQFTTFAGFVCNDQAGTTRRNILVLAIGFLVVLWIYVFAQLVAGQSKRQAEIIAIISGSIVVIICGAIIFFGTEWGCSIF